MGDHGDALAKAISHQAAARATPLDQLSPFSLSNLLPRNEFCVVSKVSKERFITAVQTEVPRAAGKLQSEKEVIQVLHSQLPNAITTSVFDSLPKLIDDDGNSFTLPPLPGGASLADHNLAAIRRSSDWSSAEPMAAELCANRLPTPGELGNTKEITIGTSTRAEWREVMEFVQTKLSEGQNNALSLMASDTESVPLKVDWSLDSGRTKPWQALLFHINMEALSGAKQLEFTIAKERVSACNLPTRFFFGTRDWQIHLRLPVTYKRKGGDTQVILNLNTVLPEEAKQLLLSLPP